MSTPRLSDSQARELLAFAFELADAAGAVILPRFRQPMAVDNKLDGEGFDPVTEADRGAEQAIRDLINRHYPDHGIMGEEFGHQRGTSGLEWVLDPIDGTRAFISGLPTWGTLISLTVDGEPILGILDQPYLKERFHGGPHGAFLNERPIHCRRVDSLAQATMSTTGFQWFTPGERKAYQTVEAACQLVRYGLDCYAYGILAHGFLDIVMEAGLNTYDISALVPIVRAAGGSVTTWQGGDPAAGGQILATGSPALEREALDLLARERLVPTD